LLTGEAMQTYAKQLDDRGLLLFHISNRYYDLRAVIKATASEVGLVGVMNELANADYSRLTSPSQCIVLARDVAPLQPLIDRGWMLLGKDDGLAEAVPWTDDYVNILPPLLSRFRKQ
jgi:hypothetical protein